ncbi:sensor domain-containing diguanylate cyclase [Fusobacterium sp.]|uniref:sensor domain-containing diguanylate cyclase n=1 Tax=Fusobacterium sp. TaxID=68766 RepID=UPI00260C53CB|nr:sensor domain-containing diguanylate cyclase [Fusobacterium sp.]
MEKWLISKENKKIAVIVVISFAIIFMEMMQFINLKNNLYNISLDQSMERINRVSGYVEKSFSSILLHYQKELKLIGKQLKIDRDILSENMEKQIREITYFSNFVEIGISDFNGNAVDSKGKRYYSKSRTNKAIRDMIKKGKPFVSNVVREDKESLIFIIVPLKNNGKIVGGFWGKVLVRDIIKYIEFDEDSDRYFQIIDGEGSYILPSKNKYALYTETDMKKTLWDELSLYDYFDESTPQEVHENMENGVGGNFYFEKDGEGRYVSYRKLGINNWYIFSVLVKGNLQNYVDGIQDLIMKFFIGAIVGLLVIFGIIYNLIHSMYKKLEEEYHRTQNTNLMFSGILKETKTIPFVVDREYRAMYFYGYPSYDSREEQSFNFLKPENMLKNGKIDEENLNNYLKFYNSAIVEGKACEPVILYVMIGSEKRWVRIRFIEKSSFEGRLVGVLEGYDEQIEKDLKIENQQDNIKKIEEKSQFDFLTRVYNRETFAKKVKSELKNIDDFKEMYAFIIIDIDNFKNINDYLGHKAGDNVLKDIGKELRNNFRKEDIIGRLGGDEFVIFLKNIKDVDSFEKRMELLNKRLYKEYERDDIKIAISGSIGVVISDRYLPFIELYEKADEALYKVKHSGRNGYEIYFDK